MPRFEPQILGSQEDTGKVHLELLVPLDLYYFQGHFPQLKILPGVVQVHWAIMYAKKYLNISTDFSGFPVIKFINPIRPGQKVNLDIFQLSSSHCQLQFSYSYEQREYSNGKFKMGE